MRKKIGVRVFACKIVRSSIFAVCGRYCTGKPLHHRHDGQYTQTTEYVPCTSRSRHHTTSLYVTLLESLVFLCISSRNSVVQSKLADNYSYAPNRMSSYCPTVSIMQFNSKGVWVWNKSEKKDSPIFWSMVRKKSLIFVANSSASVPFWVTLTSRVSNIWVTQFCTPHTNTDTDKNLLMGYWCSTVPYACN